MSRHHHEKLSQEERRIASERPLNQQELDRIAAERRDALRKSAEEKSRTPEVSRRDREETVAALHEKATLETTDEQDEPEYEKPLGKRRSYLLSKHEREQSFKKQMDAVQQELSPTEKNFSKFIHHPAVETLSDWSAASIARPNALLGASIAAFITVTIVYIIAKYIGFRLSGFEIIAAFIGGWLLGMLYDYFKALTTGRKRR